MVERSQNPDVTKAELSKVTQDAFDVYLEEHNRDVPFKTVLEHVVDVAFHEGGDSSSNLVWALMNEVDNGVLREPITDCVRHAVAEGYGEEITGEEMFNMDELTAFLKDYLGQLPPGAKVTDVISTLISDGLTLDERSFGPLLNVSKHFTNEWILSPPVIKILEDHYKRLIREYVPTIYAREIEASPIDHIYSHIRGKIVSFDTEIDEEGSPNVVLSFENPIGNLKALIFSFLNAASSDDHSFERFRVHFMHALTQLKETPTTPEDGFAMAVFDIAFWDVWLKPTWEQAMTQYKAVIKTRQALDKPVLPKKANRDAIVQQNASRARDRRRRLVADGLATGTKKAAPSIQRILYPEIISSDPESQVIAYNLSGGKRLLCNMYHIKNSNMVGYILTLESPVNGEGKPTYVRLKKHPNIKPLTLVAGDSGELKTIKDLLYGGDLEKLDVSRRDVNDIPHHLFATLREFARRFVQGVILS